jgi:hypothetical protein
MKKTALVLLQVLLIIVFMQMTAFAQDITGAIPDTGDKVSVLADLNIETETDGNVIVILGNADIQNDVYGDVVVILGNADINARVSGQVVSVLGEIILADGAVITGDVVSIGGLEKATGASINGQEIELPSGDLDRAFRIIMAARIVPAVTYGIIVLALGLVLITISREKFEYISVGIEREILKKFFIGFLGFIGATILTILLFITIVAPLLYFALLAIGGVVSSIFVGKLILRHQNPGASIYAQFMAGLIAVTLLKAAFIYLIPVGDILLGIILYLFISILIVSIGIGILLDLKFSKKY